MEREIRDKVERDVRTAQFEVVEDDGGNWHWRLRAPNGEVLAHSESYPDKRSAVKGVESAKLNAGAARVEIAERGRVE